MNANNFFKTSDGAYLYYNDVGTGTPLVFVNGFMCTTKFYEKNVSELSKQYRVITYDPRGYGLSSKTLTGNTLLQQAIDLKDLIDYLDLDNVILFGWSLGTGTVALYADMFKEHKLAGIGLIDSFLSPFSGEEWNKYAFANYNVEKYILGRKLWFTDLAKYQEYFFNVVYCEELTSEDKDWILDQISMTMPWTGIELHLDYCHADTMACVEKITVPTIIYAGNSAAIPACVSEEAFKRLKGEKEYHYFDRGGHMFFYSHSEKFNQVTLDFIKNKIKL